MKANLGDLNDLLFEQLERINDDDLVGDKLQEQVIKSRTIISISGAIINNAKLMLDAHKYIDNGGEIEGKQSMVLLGEKKE